MDEHQEAAESELGSPASGVPEESIAEQPADTKRGRRETWPARAEDALATQNRLVRDLGCGPDGQVAEAMTAAGDPISRERVRELLRRLGLEAPAGILDIFVSVEEFTRLAAEAIGIPLLDAWPDIDTLWPYLEGKPHRDAFRELDSRYREDVKETLERLRECASSRLQRKFPSQGKSQRRAIHVMRALIHMQGRRYFTTKGVEEWRPVLFRGATAYTPKGEALRFMIHPEPGAKAPPGVALYWHRLSEGGPTYTERLDAAGLPPTGLDLE